MRGVVCVCVCVCVKVSRRRHFLVIACARAYTHTYKSTPQLQLHLETCTLSGFTGKSYNFARCCQGFSVPTLRCCERKEIEIIDFCIKRCFLGILHMYKVSTLLCTPSRYAINHNLRLQISFQVKVFKVTTKYYLKTCWPIMLETNKKQVH